jgi:hypothetical protein
MQSPDPGPTAALKKRSVAPPVQLLLSLCLVGLNTVRRMIRVGRAASGMGRLDVK